MKEDLSIFTTGGFSFFQNFFKSGILFIEDEGISANCPFGGNELHIRCKSKEKCDASIAKLELILQNLK